MMKELVEDSCVNVTVSKDTSNIAINKLNEFKKKMRKHVNHMYALNDLLNLKILKLVVN